MAVRIFQFSVVFAIGYLVGPAEVSAVATLETEIPLSLNLKDPKDVTVGRGQSAALECEAQSLNSDLKISWLYEGNLISTNGTEHQQFSNGTLYIPKVIDKKMEGRYRCIAKNDIGSLLSNPANLKIASIGLEFIEQPGNVSVSERQPIILPCQIQSVPDAVIHWERNNVPLPHNPRYVPLPTGALLITSTHSSDAGLYRCIVTNKILNENTKHSKSGQLTVLPPLRLIEPLKFLPLGLEPKITALVGSNLTLYCIITGWPIPTIQWVNVSNMNILQGNSSILELQNVTRETTGNYSCIADNSEDRVILNYQVQIYQAPYFNITPKSISYPPARTLRLNCNAIGIPQPEVYWLKNGEILKTSGRIKRLQNGLLFSHSFVSDAGIYQCVAVNLVGNVWTSTQLVPYDYKDRPNPPRNVKCRPFDNDSVCLTWSRPAVINITIKAYSVYAYSKGTKGLVFATDNNYRLADGLNNSTNYTFYVLSFSNKASDKSSNVTCAAGIQGKRNLQIISLTETSVKMTWFNVSNDISCGSTIAQYKVQWRRINQPGISFQYTENLYKVIKGLRALSTYEFRIQSTTNKRNNNRWTTFSLTKEKSSTQTTITTSDYTEIYELNETSTILPTPAQIEVELLSPYSINVTWSSIEEEENLFYALYCIDVKEEKYQVLESKENYLEVQNLKPDTLYEFKVRSQNPNGNFSPYSHSVEVQTCTDIPSPVQHLQYMIVNATTVCIKWQNPLHKNGKLTKYIILYTPDQNWPLEQWHYIEILEAQVMLKACWPNEEEDEVSVIIPELSSEFQYTLLVRAASEAGLGNPTVPVIFSTKNAYSGIFDQNFEEDDSLIHEYQDEIHYKQKLGIAIGVSVSILCILCCLSCIIFRRRCMKREALPHTGLATSNNYYSASSSMPYPGTALQLRHHESCSAEAHEMQHLVGEDHPSHIPALTPAHLDTKGGVGFPNGQLNGSLKHMQMNGPIANGHVHITENPRYDYHDCNGHINSKKFYKRDGLLLRNYKQHEDHNLQEDCNSKTVTANHESSDLAQISDNSYSSCKTTPYNHSPTNKCPVTENGKFSSKCYDAQESLKIPDYNSNCNSELNEIYGSNLKLNDSLQITNKEDDLDNTQLTCLEDSFSILPVLHRRSPPALGPNG